jgi:hypothetical protein
MAHLGGAVMTENTPDAVKVLERLIATARLLYANAEGCAVNHHGADFELHGMPGWLTDCAADIAAAQSLGARAMQAAMAGRAGRVKVLETAMREACDLLAERTYGSTARSPGHNARLRLEEALASIEPAGAQEGVPDLVPVTITNTRTGETRQAYVDRSRGVVLERDATAAEAERDALKAEVERKDKAIVGAFEFAGRARGTALGLAISGKDNPKLDSGLMKLHEDGLEVERTIRAALSPAKAGG